MNFQHVTGYVNIAGGTRDHARAINAWWIQFWFWRIQSAETHVGSYKLEKYLFGVGLMMGWPYFQRHYNYVPPDHVPERNRGQKKKKKIKATIICWRWPMSFMVFYRNHQFAKPMNAVLKRDFNGYHSWD